jgi:two-component system sensor histidine kinase ChvG
MRKILENFYFQQDLYFKILDRVIFFDNEFNLIGDTDTLDLDPRSFSTRLDKLNLKV